MKYCNLHVCLSSRTSQKRHVQILRNFLYLLPVAAAWSFSNESALRHELPVLWMTSCFHIMEPMGQHQRRDCFVKSEKRQHQCTTGVVAAYNCGLVFQLFLFCNCIYKFIFIILFYNQYTNAIFNKLAPYWTGDRLLFTANFKVT